MENMIMGMTITKQDFFDEDAKMVDCHGIERNASDDSVSLNKVCNGFQVNFEIQWQGKNWKQGDFIDVYNMVFQNEERDDKLKAYSEYGMTPAYVFGCDEDQTLDFLEYNNHSGEAENAIFQLEVKAETLCSAWIINNFSPPAGTGRSETLRVPVQGDEYQFDLFKKD